MSYTWSYSSLSLFQQCPRKYYRLRVAKDIVEPPQEHLRYGTDVHKAAENYVCCDVPLPAKYDYMRPQLDVLKALPGEKFCEYEMGLTKDLQPCAFRAKDVWFRGIADLLVIDGDRARIVDYKTGKSSRYADTKQLELLSLLVFKHFPHVTSVKAGLVFVVAKDLVRAEYAAEKQDAVWQKWLPEVTRLDQAYSTGVWNPRANFTCRNYCAVKDCEHNGANR
ncbi:MAG: PD-(D/E)XK nuclease family protein [Altererythrobacter sp.]|jgi:PD-(D/E)XK nuclease superfamily|nr:PD-(D/E)XK nuclease family protein [Altererythrobacter sp.]